MVWIDNINGYLIMSTKYEYKLDYVKKFFVVIALITVLMFMISTQTNGSSLNTTTVPLDLNGKITPQTTINLGTAGNFASLSKTGISTTGTTAVVGDIGVSPAAASYITGFSLILASGNASSTSSLVTGKIYASDYSSPTPTMLTTAIGDMGSAYNESSGRTNPDHTELGSGSIGGLTLQPGLYKWGTSVAIETDVTISGSSSDVWVFQIAQDLSISSGKKILLSGGAVADNVFWTVAGQTTLETNSVFNGNILCKTAIVLNTGATLNGRALAQTAVTLDSNAVTMPEGVSATTTTTVATTATNSKTTTPAASSPGFEVFQFLIGIALIATVVKRFKK
jgi:hypothetical protein